MTNAKELAETYMAAARTLFIRDGEVSPIVVFSGGPTDLLVEPMPNPQFHPSDQACAIVFGFATVMEATHVVAVNETWMKAFDPNQRPESMERGYLEQLHRQGDLAVHTALLVIVADLKDHEASRVFSHDVEAADNSETWTQRDLELGSGSYLDRILIAWDEGKRVAREAPHGGTWADVAAMLARMRAISSVTHVGPDDDIADLIQRSKAGEN